MAEGVGPIRTEVLVRFPGCEAEVIGTVDIPMVAVPVDGGEYGRALMRLSPTAQAFANAEGLPDRG